MVEYMFGCGPGHLTDREDRVARSHGAYLVNFTDTQCNCGYGCRPHSCPRSRRHWFCAPNNGAGGAIATAVLAALEDVP